MLIPRRSVRTSQPQHVARIDWSNPLAKKLLIYSVPGIDDGNTALGKLIHSGVGKKVMRQGVAGDFSATSHIRAGVLPDSALTIVCGAVSSNDGSYRHLFGTNYTGGYESLVLRSYGGYFQLNSYYDGGGGGVAQVTNPADGTYATFFSTLPPVGQSGVVTAGHVSESGVITSGSSSFSPLTRIGSTAYIGAGAAGSSAWRQYAKPILYCYVFSGQLADYEIQSIARNPWQIFEDEEEYRFIPAAGGSSTLNATASGGDAASGTASLAAQVALAAIGVSSASGAGNLSASIPLSAAGLSVSDGSANADATITISASGLAQAAGQAGLSANVLLAAAGAAQASGNATLAAQLNALAAGAAQAGGSANLTGGAAGALSASGGDVAGGSAVLSVTVGLVAAGAAQAVGAANGQANAPGAISAAGGATASGQAILSSLVTLTAAGFVQAMGAGAMTITVPLSASGQANSSGHAAPGMTGLVRNFRLRAESPTRLTRLAVSADRLTTIHHGVSHG